MPRVADVLRSAILPVRKARVWQQLNQSSVEDRCVIELIFERAGFRLGDGRPNCNATVVQASAAGTNQVRMGAQVDNSKSEFLGRGNGCQTQQHQHGKTHSRHYSASAPPESPA